MTKTNILDLRKRITTTLNHNHIFVCVVPYLVSTMSIDPDSIEMKISQMRNELQQNIEKHKNWLLKKERNFVNRVVSKEIIPTAGLLRQLNSAIVKIKNSKQLLDSWSSMVQSIYCDIRCKTFELKSVRDQLQYNARETPPFDPFFDDKFKAMRAKMSKIKRSKTLAKKIEKIESLIRKDLAKFFEIDSFNRGIVCIKQRKHTKKLNLNDVLKIIDDLSESGSPLERAAIDVSHIINT